MADPATFLASNSVLGNLFENNLFIQLWKNIYISEFSLLSHWFCKYYNSVWIWVWISSPKLRTAPLRLPHCLASVNCLLLYCTNWLSLLFIIDCGSLCGRKTILHSHAIKLRVNNHSQLTLQRSDLKTILGLLCYKTPQFYDWLLSLKV